MKNKILFNFIAGLSTAAFISASQASEQDNFNFEDLPKEVKYNIFEYVDAKSLLQYAASSKKCLEDFNNFIHFKVPLLIRDSNKEIPTDLMHSSLYRVGKRLNEESGFILNIEAEPVNDLINLFKDVKLDIETVSKGLFYETIDFENSDIEWQEYKKLPNNLASRLILRGVTSKNVRNDVIEIIEKKPNISNLKIDRFINENWDTEIIQKLKEIESVKKINLEMTLRFASLANIGLVGNLPKITRLELRDSNIGDGGAIKLFEILAKNENIRSINLISNNIGDIGAQYIATNIHKLISLTAIDLSYNRIQDNGAKAFSDLVKEKNTGIKSITLCYNLIGDVGMQYLIDALKVNQIQMRLHNNQINSEAIKNEAENLVQEGDKLIKNNKL